jgi:hypothetical protein
MTSRIATLSAVVALSLLASSCSYLTMQRPETLDKDMPVCVSNKLAPTIDSVQAAGNGLSTIGYTAAAIAGSQTNFTTGSAVGAAIGSAIATAIWTASAVSGFKRVKACKEVKVDYFNERRGSQPAPRANPPMRNDSRSQADTRNYEDPPVRQERREPPAEQPGNDSQQPEENQTPEGDSEKYMSLKEAAMHCGASRRSIWNRIDDGTFSTRRTEQGTMLLSEEVREECGEEPEVPLD